MENTLASITKEESGFNEFKNDPNLDIELSRTSEPLVANKD